MGIEQAGRLADSLARLGTETAFSVLARAKQLEREGRDVIHLEIGEPRLRHPGSHLRGGDGGHARGAYRTTARRPV